MPKLLEGLVDISQSQKIRTYAREREKQLMDQRTNEKVREKRGEKRGREVVAKSML